MDCTKFPPEIWTNVVQYPISSKFLYAKGDTLIPQCTTQPCEFYWQETWEDLFDEDPKEIDFKHYRLISVLIPEKIYEIMCSSSTENSALPKFLYPHVCDPRYGVSHHAAHTADVPLSGLKLIEHHGQNYRELRLQMEPNSTMGQVCIQSYVHEDDLGRKKSLLTWNRPLLFKILYASK